MEFKEFDRIIDLEGNIFIIYEIKENHICLLDTEGMYSTAVNFDNYRLYKKEPISMNDTVVGNKFANIFYGITREGWVGQVTEIISDTKIAVTGVSDNICFEVYSCCFDVLDFASKLNEKDKDEFLVLIG